jgi:hypothetical protein
MIEYLHIHLPADQIIVMHITICQFLGFSGLAYTHTKSIGRNCAGAETVINIIKYNYLHLSQLDGLLFSYVVIDIHLQVHTD